MLRDMSRRVLYVREARVQPAVAERLWRGKRLRFEVLWKGSPSPLIPIASQARHDSGALKELYALRALWSLSEGDFGAAPAFARLRFKVPGLKSRAARSTRLRFAATARQA